MNKIFLAIILSISTTSVFTQNNAYISTQEAISDIDYLMKSIEEIHYNPFFKTSKESIYSEKERLLSGFDKDSITLKKFIATGMILTAQMSGGHTSLNWQNSKIIPEVRATKYVPFTGKLVDNNQKFIVTNTAIPELKIGDVITSINEVSIIELYTECLSYIGGIESFKKATCEKVFPLYVMFTEKINFPYSIKTDITNSVIESAGLGVPELNKFLRNNSSVDNYTFEIIEDNIGLITYNRCVGLKKFDKFLKKTFQEIQKNGINKLIIDIRENGGGNSDLNESLLAYLTKTAYQQGSGRYWKVSSQAKQTYSENKIYTKMNGVEFMKKYCESDNLTIIEDFSEELTYPNQPKNYFNGKTCFLIGPNTFSSANFLADAIKTYNLSTLIGSATGEYTNDFGEQISFKLPNSGNYVYVSSTYDIGANGNKDVLEPVYPDIKVENDILQFAVKWINKD